MEDIIKFVKENDYESAEYKGEYKGYKVYSTIYRDDGEVYCIGLPAFILEKDGALKWVQDEESFEIMDYFYPY